MRTRALIQHFLSIIVLSILLTYSYVNLVLRPNLGFYFNDNVGEVLSTSTPTQDPNSIQPGDILVKVGPLTFADYLANLRLPLFPNITPDQEIEIEVTRQGQNKLIIWTVPEPTWTDFLLRLANFGWLVYFFWLAGLVTVILIRPIDLRQTLLVAFLYLTAIWLMLGSIEWTHLWHSAVLFRAVTWLCVPVYLHLHWEFPQPIGHTPKKFWGSLYLVALVLALTQWFELLPTNISRWGFLVAMGGSITLLIVHYILKRDQRRDVAILVIITILAFVPSLVYIIVSYAGTPTPASVLVLFFLAGLPGAYFYVAYRRQPGWLEFRANRLVAIYLFLIILFAITLLTVGLITRWQMAGLTILQFSLIMIGVVLLSIFGFPPFQHWVDKRLLGLPLDREGLVESCATRITSSLSRNALNKLLREQLLPTLQIRQSAILQQSLAEEFDIVYLDGIQVKDLPPWNELTEIPTNAGPIHPLPDKPAWVRLAVPLKLDGHLQGTWLFGRHDPDDIYSHEDVRLLEILGHQTAVALSNINQTELLQNLYKANIQRQEEERTILARGLHDEVLNDLAVLGLFRHDDERFASTLKELAARIRLMIRGLRPAILDYGLWRALEDLVNDLQDRLPAELSLKLELPQSEVRYPIEIEQNFLRIVQQAIENALEHAQASAIRVHGWLDEGEVLLIVEDNGRGFPDPRNLNITKLLENKHYGIAGMIERAELIGAKFEIISESGSFTRITLHWPAGSLANGAAF